MRTACFTFSQARSVGIFLNLLSEILLHLVGQAEVLANRVEGTILVKRIFELFADRAPMPRAHKHAMAVRQAGDILRNSP